MQNKVYSIDQRVGENLLKEVFQHGCCASHEKVSWKLSLGDGGKILLVHK